MNKNIYMFITEKPKKLPGSGGWGETFLWTLGLLETLRRGVLGGGSNKRLCEEQLRKSQ